jgi:CRISPR/Cas system-associated endoribonuclease Cas2
MNRLWVIAYDIEDDAVRRRVHDILKNHGQRRPVQRFRMLAEQVRAGIAARRRQG